MRKVILMLFLCVVFLYVSSCTSNDNVVESTASATEDITVEAIETSEMVYLPQEANYNGYEFLVLVTGNFANNDFMVIEDTADVINNAKFIKNSKVEEQFGVSISNVDKIAFGSTGGSGPGYAAFRQSYISASYDYDMGMIGSYDCATLAYSGYLTNLHSIPYINLSRSWWDQKANEDLTIKGRLYFTTGDISITDNLVTNCILFNKDIVKEYDTLRNPYELVESNNWTYDTFAEEIKKVYEDLNSNDKPDRDDRFGFLTWNDAMLGVLASANQRIAKVDSDGILELTFYNERTQTVIDKYCSIVFDPIHTINYQFNFTSSEWNPLRDEIFSNNRALYYATVFTAGSRYRDMKTDYGILPYPKLSADQEDYGNLVNPFHSQFVVVPALIEDEDRTGALIEAFAYYSKEYLTPAFYEKTLVGLYIRDEESSKMLDIIFASRAFDLGIIYKVGSLSSTLVAMNDSRQNNITSIYKALEKSTLDQITSINEKFNAIEQ